MKQKICALLAIVIALVLVTGISLFLRSNTVLAQSQIQDPQVIQNALSYLKSQQQTNGGILGFSGASDPDTTARSLIALVSAGQTVSTVISSQGNSMLDYLSSQAITYTQDTTGTLFPGRAGILLSAITAAGENPTNFGGIDVVTKLEASFNPDTGTYSTTAKQAYSSGAASDLNQSWAILGLSLAGREIPTAATQYLVQSQAVDGSWGAGDPDTTALVTIALLSSKNVGMQTVTIQNAIKYFHNTQQADGGWKPSWDTDPLNADSTGWILEALISTGEDPTNASWTKDGVNPIQALAGLQKADGSIGGTYANAYSTAEAIIGLSLRPLSSLAKSPVIHYAGLAVFSDGDSFFTDCVSFTEDSISGLELLQRSGLAIQTATNPSQGTAVCKIGDVGNSADNCFGSMPDYWSYWQRGPNGWEYAVTGADQSKVMDGEVNAWSWGSGNPPALIGYQNICEGVAFVLPTTPLAPLPAAVTPLPQPSTAASTPIPSQPISTTTGYQARVGQYIVYGAIVIVVAALFFYLIRSRSK